jgi:putative tryptophan/tyrosine transport system substrate-binding protein
MIGFLSTGSVATYVAAFTRGMSEIGYVEGRNVAITYRSAEGKVDQLDTLANDLVRRQVKLIAASGGLISAKAAMKARKHPYFVRKRFRPSRSRSCDQP